MVIEITGTLLNANGHDITVVVGDDTEWEYWKKVKRGDSVKLKILNEGECEICEEKEH